MLGLRDLLGENLNDKLEIKMCPDGSGQLYVPGLTVQAVKSVEDINKVRAALRHSTQVFYSNVFVKQGVGI